MLLKHIVRRIVDRRKPDDRVGDVDLGHAAAKIFDPASSRSKRLVAAEHTCGGSNGETMNPPSPSARNRLRPVLKMSYPPQKL